MASISGQSTSNIDNVDGFFTTQGGGGGTASTTPTISLNVGLFGSVTITVTNHSSYTNPNYHVISKVGSTVTVQDADVNHGLESAKDSLTGILSFSDQSSTTGTRTVEVRAQEFGDNVQSAAATATYDITGPPASRYVRVRGVNSSGTYTNARLGIWDLRFYEGVAQSGTSHPTNMVSATTDTSGNTYYTIDAGHYYNQYYPYKAFNSSTSVYDLWWPLSTSTANNWIQVKFDETQFSTPPSINSIKYGNYGSGSDATHFALETSDDGSTFTQRGVFELVDSNTSQNFG